MSLMVSESQSYKNFTSTTTIAQAGLKMLGIFCASSSGGTIKVQDGSSTVVNTFTTVAGTFYPMPAEMQTSLVLTVTGTLDATVFYSL